MPCGEHGPDDLPGIAGLGIPPQIAERADQLQAAAGLSEGTTGARDFTFATLRRWCTVHSCQDIIIVVSELVTNALLHGCAKGSAADQVELLLWRRAGQMVCAVIDPGPLAPVLVSPGPLAEAGRGLQVVQALSVTWGWTRLGGRRKVVWAALRLPR